MAEEILDSRKHARKRTIYYFKIYERESGELLGNVVDLTVAGLMVVSRSSFELDKEFRFIVELPFKIGDVGKIHFDAKSIWSECDINPEFRDTGFKITDISTEDASRIEWIIDNYAFKG